MSNLQFLAPVAFSALIPLGAAIIVLYLLKLRRREFVVPSTFLWRHAADDLQANAPFQKLRRNLLMLLQLVALALLVAGLSSPYVVVRRAGGKNVVIVLDASASMGATDVAGSRFDQARKRAVQIVGGMGRNDSAAVVVAGARPWAAMPFSRDKRAMTRQLGALKPTDSPTNMRDALLLSLSLLSNRPEGRIYVISDGAFPPITDVSATADIRFLRVGESNDNVALLAFAMVEQPRSRAQQLFVRLRNGDAPRQCVLSIYHEEDLIEVERLQLRPNESRVVTYDMILSQPGLLRAQLDAEDDLAADNVAYAYGIPSSSVSVLLVTAGNLFLEQGLLVLPEVDVFKASSLTAEEIEDARGVYDVIIFDRVSAAAPVAEGGVLYVCADGPGAPARLGRQIAAPTITRWERAHPVTRHLNLSAVRIARAKALELSDTATPLAMTGEEPLVAIDSHPGLRTASLGWDLMDTDMPLRVGFPVFLSNCIRWLSQEARSKQLTVSRPGRLLSFSVPEDAGFASVALPDATKAILQVNEGQVAFAETDRVGEYRMQVGHEQRRWALDMRDPAESDLTPGQEMKLGGRIVRADVGPPQSERHLWPYVALLAVMFLLAEWHLYHRR